MVAQFGAGVAHAHVAGDVTGSELRTLQANLAARGARLEVEGAPSSQATVLEATSAALDPAARDLLARTKQAYDPQGVFPPLAGLGGWT
jgi:FAD/FMN-containing dehydrogenase